MGDRTLTTDTNQESSSKSESLDQEPAGQDTSPAKSASSWYSNPVVIASILVVLVVLVVWLDQSGKLKDSPNESLAQGSGATPAPISIKPPDLSKGTSNVPSLQNVPIGGAPQGAPGLDQLISGLEQKVKDDPKNVNKRILLAQTYNELGSREKALTELKIIQKDFPENKRARLVLASILSQSDNTEEVDESLALLTTLNNAIGIQPYLVEMYRGDALIRKQDHAGALRHWKKALKDMPAADNRRPILEKRITDLGKPLDDNDKAVQGSSS